MTMNAITTYLKCQFTRSAIYFCVFSFWGGESEYLSPSAIAQHWGLLAPAVALRVKAWYHALMPRQIQGKASTDEKEKDACGRKRRRKPPRRRRKPPRVGGGARNSGRKKFPLSPPLSLSHSKSFINRSHPKRNSEKYPLSPPNKQDRDLHAPSRHSAHTQPQHTKKSRCPQKRNETTSSPPPTPTPTQKTKKSWRLRTTASSKSTTACTKPWSPAKARRRCAA